MPSTGAPPRALPDFAPVQCTPHELTATHPHLWIRGSGRGGKFTENCPKMLLFLGNSMTIKFRNFANFIVRNFVVIWGAPIGKPPLLFSGDAVR